MIRMAHHSWRFCAVGAVSCAAGAMMASLLGACASDETAAIDAPDTAISVPPPPDAATDDGALADTGICTGDDCAFFPSECTPDALCPNGPFDPVNPDVGMDWRTRINVIRGRSPSDVWLAGAVGAVAHFDGTSWTTSVMGTQESQRALWLPASGEVALGSLQRIYTRGLGAGDGGADAAVSAGGWSLRAPLEPPPDFGFLLTAAWAAPGASTSWLATDSTLWRMRLTSESELEIVPGIPSAVCGAVPCNRVLSMHGATPTTLWAVGEFGTALRVTDADGDAPAVKQLDSQTLVGLTGVWAASDTDVWAVGGSGTIRHYTGDPLRWDIVPNVPTNENLNTVWGTSSSDVWVAGNAGVVLHYDGTTWSRVKLAGVGLRRPELYALWSPGAGHVWVAGYGVALSLGGKP